MRELSYPEFRAVMERDYRCQPCQGTGKVEERPCNHCKGSGWNPRRVPPSYYVRPTQ